MVHHYIEAIYYSVPAYFPISEELHERLNRLVQLSVQMGRLRERSTIVNSNISHFKNQEGVVRIHPNKYFMYEEKQRAEELKEAMLVLQDEMDDLQREIMFMIYGPVAVGPGGNTQ